MKVARYVLKVTALALSIAAVVCCVIAFWDKITQGISAAADQLRSRRTCGADGCCADYDDYADWDE